MSTLKKDINAFMFICRLDFVAAFASSFLSRKYLVKDSILAREEKLKIWKGNKPIHVFSPPFTVRPRLFITYAKSIKLNR